MEAVLEVVKRTTTGKNENNRTRAAGQLPAVVYGAQKAGDAVAPVPVSVDPKSFMRIITVCSTTEAHSTRPSPISSATPRRSPGNAVMISPSGCR